MDVILYVSMEACVCVVKCVIVNDFHDNVMYTKNEMQILRLILYWLDLMLNYFFLNISKKYFTFLVLVLFLKY